MCLHILCSYYFLFVIKHKKTEVFVFIIIINTYILKIEMRNDVIGVLCGHDM